MLARNSADLALVRQQHLWANEQTLGTSITGSSSAENLCATCGIEKSCLVAEHVMHTMHFTVGKHNRSRPVVRPVPKHVHHGFMMIAM